MIQNACFLFQIIYVVTCKKYKMKWVLAPWVFSCVVLFLFILNLFYNWKTEMVSTGPFHSRWENQQTHFSKSFLSAFGDLYLVKLLSQQSWKTFSWLCNHTHNNYLDLILYRNGSEVQHASLYITIYPFSVLCWNTKHEKYVHVEQVHKCYASLMLTHTQQRLSF